MAKFCLIPKAADEFIKRLKSGEISPEKLNALSSKERQAYFETFMDKKSAKETNLLFEKKILLKNQERGLIRWAEQLSGTTTKQKKALIEKIKKNKAERLKRTFSPEEEEQFLDELVESKLGIGISEEESKTIFELAQKVQDGEELFDKNKIHGRLQEIIGTLNGGKKKVIDELVNRLDSQEVGEKVGSAAITKVKRYLSGENPTDKMKKNIEKLVDDIVAARKNPMEYGAARVALDDYVGDIKLGIKEPYNFDMKTAGRVVSDVAGFAKSIVPSIDNSFIGRQGLYTLASGHPVIWGKTFLKSFELIAKSIGGDEALKGLRASIYARPNSMNGTYERMKLAVGQGEEAYPTSLPEKIPILGRVFKASQEAFTGSAYYMRAELADALVAKRLKQGVDLSDKEQAESLGILINSMTGRGTEGIGRLGQKTNVIFFSPKYLQSNLDKLTAHAFSTKVTGKDKLEAAKNLLTAAATIGGVLYTADQLKPGSVEWDPRSSDFGKIRIGDTRFEVSGGLGSFVSLVSRIKGGVKDSTTGVITKPGDYGGRDVGNLLLSFTENKLSPLFGSLVDILKGEDFHRDPYTMQALKEDPVDVTWRLVKGVMLPLPAQNAPKNFEKFDTGTALAITLVDGLGIGTNTYGFRNNWNDKPGVELEKFREKVGKETFKAENENYAKAVNEKILNLRLREEFKSKSDEDKKKILEKLKDQEKDKIFKKYNFKYVQKRKDAIRESKKDISLLKSL